MKHLIVNADDFGLLPEINDGILNCYKHGIVTSASLMANGRGFEDAIGRLTPAEGLAVGIHLVLVEESPILLPGEVPSLVDANGKLPVNSSAFLKAFALGRIDKIDIEKELRAQFEHLLRFGIQPQHADSHQHLHIYGPILEIVIALCREFHVPWIRNIDGLFIRRSAAARRLKMAYWAKYAKKRIRESGFGTEDYFWGLQNSGRLNKESIQALLEKTKDGVNTLMCHPGRNSRALSEAYGHWNFNWEEERRALTSPDLSDRIEELGVHRTDYLNLCRTKSTSHIR